MSAGGKQRVRQANHKRVWTEESRKKAAAAKLGTKQTPEHKEKIRKVKEEKELPHRGYKLDNKTRRERNRLKYKTQAKNRLEGGLS